MFVPFIVLDCESIFGPPLLIAHPLLPYFKLLTPLSGIFEVKCDRQTNELTDRTDAMIVPFIYIDVFAK